MKKVLSGIIYWGIWAWLLAAVGPAGAAATAPGSRPALAASNEPFLTVLCYHKFGPEKKSQLYQISPRRFEAQLAWLKKEGYTYLSLTQVAAFLDGSLAPVPAKPVGITIDDGWDSGFYIARPLLKKYGFRGVFMVVTGSQAWKKRISWEQMKAMEAEGFEFASHSMEHTKLFRPLKEQPLQYRNRLKKELAGSKAMMEEKLGHPVAALAYPYGGFNPVVEEAARAAGYKLVFTVTRGGILPGDNPLRLKRTMLAGRPELAAFQNMLRTRPLRISARGIEDGEFRVFSAFPRTITLTAGPGLQPAELSGAVDSHAIHFRKKGNAVTVQMPAKVLPGLHFLHVARKRKGIIYEQRWLFQVYYKEWGRYFMPEKQP